jgi:hypothetical protein
LIKHLGEHFPVLGAVRSIGRMERTKAEFLRYLDSLGSYIEAGIWDYLRDTDLATYIAVGDMERDVELRKAVMTVRRFVAIDEFPWWEEFAGATPERRVSV